MTESPAAVLQLLLREEWRGGPDRHAGSGWLEAAAALGAGEPKRALAALGSSPEPPGDRAAIDRVLRKLAATLEHNWFPGGAGSVLDPGEIAQFGLPTLPSTTREARLLVDVADFLAGLPTARSIVSGARRGHTLPGVEAVIPEAERLLARLDAAGAPMAVGPVALAVSDLHRRAGAMDRAAAAWQHALEAYGSAGDPVGTACCVLTYGDWLAGPLSHPELLGEDLEERSVGLPGDPAAALEQYADAESRYTAAGATRGMAAVALRRAAVAGHTGDAATAAAELDRCHELATAAGDGALAVLAAVHGALLAAGTGEDVPVGAIADHVAGWSTTVGSRSWARGLARLCHAKAQRWRDHVRRARPALLLAEAINDRIGAVTEPALVRRELAEQYGATNFRRAALVLALLDLTEAEEAAARSCTAVDWARLVELGMAANRDAYAQNDALAARQVLEHLHRISALEPAGDTGPLRMVLDLTIAEADVMIPRFAGVAARAEGDLAEADRWFEVALAAARARGPAGALSQVAVLGTMRRFPEALAIVEPLVGMVPAEIAATLLTRLERYDLALEALERWERDGAGAPSGTERAWDMAALRAEVLVGLGRPAEALAHSERAIARFDEHLAGLSRDVLRTMASDDVTVAGLYTTAVRAHTDLGPTHLGAAFALSDRCRGMSLGDLVDLDRRAGDGAAVTGVRAWLRAGAQLARTIEELGASPAAQRPPAAIRREIRAVERELDDAEVALATVAPAVLSSRRRLADTPALADVQERLEPGTLLVQYHAFDDQLICWAITRDSARAVPAVHDTPLLRAAVRQFHTAVSDPRSTSEQRDATGRPLSALLLAPITEELGAHRRLVVVPHGPLSMLPFHVLPHGGSDLAATHVVSYLPAASLVPRDRPRSVGRDATVLVLGDPDHGQDSALPPLPGAAVEATAIAALRGVRAVTGAAADRDTVLARLGAADVVHLATHGTLIEGSPYRSELALSGGGALTVPDLMGIDSTLSLAVLSACDSGRGRANAAGDVIGLTRALMAAGARELVVSMWPVDDKRACLTMVRFHRALMTDASPAAALATATTGVRSLSRRAANTEYRALRADGARDEPDVGRARTARETGGSGPISMAADQHHPYYWAPFVHIGI